MNVLTNDFSTIERLTKEGVLETLDCKWSIIWYGFIPVPTLMYFGTLKDK